MVHLIVFLVTVAVATVVLLVSMMIVGRFMSIDFGDATTVIAKSAGLIIAVSVCNGISPFLGLGVWLVGLMFLFKLGVVEAVVLSIVNNVVTVFVVAALVVALGIVPG
jgi:hypothetical protein